MQYDRENRLETLLTRGLAGLWIVAGLLEASPRLFHVNAVMSNVLLPQIERQPGFLVHLLEFGDNAWASHIVLFNGVAALGEIVLGMGILAGAARRRGRVALWLSLVWCALAWIFAEGLGGLMTGYSSMIYQFPGTAVLYGGLAVLLLLPRDAWQSGQVRRGLGIGMGLLWLGAAVLQALPAAGFWSGGRLAGLFGDVTMVGLEPSVLARITNDMILIALHQPFLINLLLVLIMVFLGAAWLMRPHAAWVHWATWIWLAFLWLVPEEMGTVLTGLANNPGMVWPVAVAVFALAASASVGAGRGRVQDSSQASAS